MSDQVDKEYVASLDRRITDHDSKIANTQRDHTELTHDIQKLAERINNGLSPSVNEVRKDNSEIKLAIQNLAHQFELERRDMKAMMSQATELHRAMLTNFEKARIEPVEKEIGYIRKTFIYGTIGVLITVLGHKGFNFLWDKVFKDPPKIVTTN